MNRRRPRSGFPELLVQMRSIVGMTPVEMHLKSFCYHLEFMLNSIGQNGGASFDRDDFSPKGLSSCTDNLLNFRQRFLIHSLSH